MRARMAVMAVAILVATCGVTNAAAQEPGTVVGFPDRYQGHIDTENGNLWLVDRMTGAVWYCWPGSEGCRFIEFDAGPPFARTVTGTRLQSEVEPTTPR